MLIFVVAQKKPDLQRVLGLIYFAVGRVEFDRRSDEENTRAVQERPYNGHIKQR